MIFLDIPANHHWTLVLWILHNGNSQGNGICLNANIATITDTLNVTSALIVASNAVAMQNYITARGYKTSALGSTLSNRFKLL